LAKNVVKILNKNPFQKVPVKLFSVLDTSSIQYMLVCVTEVIFEINLKSEKYRTYSFTKSDMHAMLSLILFIVFKKVDKQYTEINSVITIKRLR